jgi:TonB family protein
LARHCDQVDRARGGHRVAAMTARERPPRPPSLPRALALAGATVGIAAAIFLVALAARSQRGGTPPTELLGSQLPPGWEPGGAGVGRLPPPPPSLPTPPEGTAPEAEVVAPYGQPQQRTPIPARPDGGPPDSEEGPPPVAEGRESPVPAEEPAALSYTPPRLLSLPDPSYPRVGERMRIEATVVLRVRVSSRGRVLEAQPVGEEVGYGFEAEAIRAARRARFEPARRDGVAITADTRLAVQFRLRR